MQRSFFTVAVVLTLFLAAAGGPLTATSERVTITKVDVVDLPPTCEPGQPFIVKDGNSASDCATGTGATKVLCTCDDSGNSYTATGDGNSGGTPTQIVAGDSDMTVTDAGVGDITATVDGVTTLVLNGVGSGVNYVDITPGATAAGPTITAEGETNVDLNLTAKGTGVGRLEGGGDANEGLFVNFKDAGVDNPLEITDTACADGPCFQVQDDDLLLYGSGGLLFWSTRTSPNATSFTQEVLLKSVAFTSFASDGDTGWRHGPATNQMRFETNGDVVLQIDTDAAGVNWFNLIPGATTVGPTIASAGEATVPLVFSTAGTADFDFSNDNIDASGGIDLPAGAVDALTEIDGALCGTNEILEDQGASWACVATPAGDLTGVTNGNLLYDNADALGGVSQFTYDGTNLMLTPTSGDDIVAEEVAAEIWNDSGATIFKCAAVYISGFNVPNDLATIAVADSDDVAKMPAIGLVRSDIANGAAGFIVSAGDLMSADTAVTESWAVGDAVYVNTSGTNTSADCADTMTNVKPTGTAEIQKMALVSRANPTNGELEITGAGRANDIPNIASTNFWLGNGSGVATAVAMSSDASMDNAGAVTIAAAAVDGGTGGKIADGTVDGEDMNANYAGAYLTETAASPDTLGVDDEIVRRTFTYIVEAPTTAEDGDIQHMLDVGCTIDRVQCSVAAATSVTININERAIGTPNTTGDDALSSGLVCDVGSQSACASGCDVDTIQNQPIDATDPIALEIDSVIGTPGWLRVHVTCKVVDA